MAVFKPVINELGYGAGDGVELFTSDDIYRYDVDNRPLENLLDNDVAIKASLDDVVDEIDDSYEGTLWPTGTSPYTHLSLDSRLDNMDLFLQELFEIRNIQFSSFQQFASFLRERYTSGFMNGPFPDTFVRSNYSMENNEAAPSPYGGFYSPERGQTIKYEDEPDVDVNKMIAMETRIEQDNSTLWQAIKKPMRILVNGYVVQLLNAHGGTNQTDQSINGRRACGIDGPVTIEFPAAPASGHRFDFSFLETMLVEVAGTGPFFPYGCRDYCIWAREQMDSGDGVSSTYDGQLEGRMLIKKTEGGHYLRIFNRSDTSAIDWDVEYNGGVGTTIVAEDNGSGGIVALNGSGVTGTIDYETGEWTLDCTGSEGSLDDVIVASYRHRAVYDPEDVRLQGTISFLPSGSYLQVQNQIRVVPGVTYETYPHWFTDADNGPNSEVEALGTKELDTVPTGPVSGYTFTNALNDLHDGTLFRAGDGGASAKTNLGTYDGYVYAVPLCAWSRFNSGAWALDNQNGGSDRPDGLTHAIPDDKHFIDLRPIVLAERYDMRAAAENTLDRIIRGDHRSVFGEATVDYLDTGNTFTGKDVWGSLVPEMWSIYEQTGAPVSAHTNAVRDIGLADSNIAGEDGSPGDSGTFTAPYAWHDGIRRLFSPQEEVQKVFFTLTDVTASTAASPSTIVSYDNTTKTITITTNSSSLSGYSATAGEGVIINDSIPRMYWRGTRQPVVLSTLWSGLGTNTATAVIDDSAETWQDNGTVDGFVDLLYPECTGIDRPVKLVDGVEFEDGSNTYTTMIKGNEDGSPDDPDMVSWKLDNSLEPGFTLPGGMCIDPTNAYVYVCDSANGRVVKLDITDLSQVAQWPVEAEYPADSVSFDHTKHLRYPSDVAVDAAGNVYVVDRESHLLTKLNSALDTRITSYGTQDTAENDPSASGTDLNAPEGVAVDTSGNVFIADTGLFRLVKLNSSLVIQDVLGNGYSGAGQDQFIQPTGLSVGAVGGDDYVYVADDNRVVQVDATNMAFENILGAKTTNNVQKFYRHTYASFYGFDEDTNGNKYCVQWDRRLLHKFDSSWNLLYTFGEDSVPLWDTDHLYHARDVIVDEDAGYVYVTNFGPEDTQGWIMIFDTDLNYVDAFDVVDEGLAGDCSGMALYQTGDANTKLYVCSHLGVMKIALPVIGSRGTASTWSADWVLDKTSTGWDTDTTKPRYVQDCALTSDGSILFFNDSIRGKVYAMDPTDVTASGNKLEELIVGWESTPHYDNNTRGLLGMEVSPNDEFLLQCGGGADPGDYVSGYDTTPHIRKIHIADAAYGVGGTTGWDQTSIANVCDQLIDTQNWQEGDTPCNIHYNLDKSEIYLMLENDMLVYNEQAAGAGDGFSQSGTAPGDISVTGSFAYNIYDLPVSIDLKLDVPWMGVRATAAVDDVLYVADVQSNTITAIDMASNFVIGTIGSPSSIGRGKASFAGPSGIAVTGEWLFYSDLFNNRVVGGYRYMPQVERGTGRVSYLIAPPSAANVDFQVRYCPYQGQWNKIGIGAVYGRHYVTENEKIFITTMGRGASANIDPSSGISYYASMTSHIPLPADVPFKAETGNIGCRITDDYLFAPQKLDILKDGGTPYVALPVITRYPSSAQEMNPWYGAGSRYDFSRFFFLQGPGGSHSVDTSGSPLNVWEIKQPRGYTANGFMPGFDTMITFPLQDISIPRLIFSSMTVELNGQGYLLIYSSYAASAGNVLNNGQFIGADVYKLFGSPGIKTRY